MRSMTFKPKTRKPPFRNELRESVTYCEDGTLEYRGLVTDTLYVWNARRHTRWVDRRDLPGLMKQFDPGKFDGGWITEFKARKEERARKREEKKTLKQSEEVAG